MIYCTTQVTIGSQNQAFNLIVDTGSANTWVGAGTTTYSSDSGQDTGQEVVGALPTTPLVMSLRLASRTMDFSSLDTDPASSWVIASSFYHMNFY